MKIYFDARMIDHPGIGRYIRSLVPVLNKVAGIELILLGDPARIAERLGVRDGVISFTSPIYSVSEQIGFMHLRRIIGSNILHIPHYNIPVVTSYPKMVVTIHDVMHIENPSGASNHYAPAYMRFMVRQAFARAQQVICVSEATRNTVAEIFGASAKMRVIYEGVAAPFSVQDGRSDSAHCCAAHGIAPRFILYVGSLRRHKNIDALLAAHAALRRRIADIALVLVGRNDHHHAFTAPGVHYLGELPDDREVAALYRSAACYCSLSLYEGFSLTILEAQASRVPVVCSDIPVHREIAGEGASFVPATAIDHIAENLYNILSNAALADELVHKGLQNIRRFNWHTAALQTADTYRKIQDESCHSP